jgi:PPK2 family polyphosphate:nucleotide phosphotransferase
MDHDKLVKNAEKIAKAFRVTNQKGFQLSQFDPRNTLEFKKSDKEKAQVALKNGVTLLSELQEKLYAQDEWGLLLIFQAMDAAGKDGAIKHVMSGINPQGCQVHSFKAPSNEDLDHDYLWRCSKALPERGRIGIFNRSYYEETLAVRVHSELLNKQKLPKPLKTKNLWKERFEDINAFEKYLTRNGILVVKFFLHVSKNEQQKRFLKRIDNPEKNWKFSSTDALSRNSWDDYQKAYEETLANTASPHAPWYVVPADNKWFTRIVVAAAIISTLESLHLQFPKLPDSERENLQKVRAQLLNKT